MHVGQRGVEDGEQAASWKGFKTTRKDWTSLSKEAFLFTLPGRTWRPGGRPALLPGFAQWEARNFLLAPKHWRNPW